MRICAAPRIGQVLLTVTLLLVFSSSAYAYGVDESIFKRIFKEDPLRGDWGWQDYVENWEFGINVQENQSPRYFADLIFPLYHPDAEDRNIFFEPRFTHLEGETLFNMGLGYRHLIFDRTWALGGNLFYDYETQYSHYRVGTGFEAISNYAELRFNSYLGLSPARTTEPGSASNIIQKAVDGLDLEVGAPFPYYSRLKLFGGYEWYNFKQFKNREGWSLRAEYKPIPPIVLDVILSDNTKRAIAWELNAAVRVPLGKNSPEDAPSPLKLDPVIFPEGDVGDRLTRLVERHHEIVVESYRESKGKVSVEVKRGT